jgi:hypothetical protein
VSGTTNHAFCHTPLNGLKALARPTDKTVPGNICGQIEPTGVMPREAARDAGATYSTMNIQALFTLAQAASNVPGGTVLVLPHFKIVLFALEDA